MVSLICGHNGTGKTRKMVEMANREVDNIKGKMVFIEANNKHIHDLNYNVRYVNTKEYGIINEDQFHGFVCGMLATDYDIEKVFIDGLYKITKVMDEEKTKLIIDKLEQLEAKFEVKFILSLNFDLEDIPESMRDKVYA